MQTFLPFSNFKHTALTLDNKRLNKQILEGYQIMKILSGASESGAWRNHPAVLMWKGSESRLMKYINQMIREANHRGIKTTKNVENLTKLKKEFSHNWGNEVPFWVRDQELLNRVVTTHKVNLYRKDQYSYAMFKSSQYDEYNKPCCEGCLYYWPTHPLRDKK